MMLKSMVIYLYFIYLNLVVVSRFSTAKRQKTALFQLANNHTLNLGILIAYDKATIHKNGVKMLQINSPAPKEKTVAVLRKFFSSRAKGIPAKAFLLKTSVKHTLLLEGDLQ